MRLNYESHGLDTRSLEAYIDENGDLVLEGADFGPRVKDFWKVGRDYEYWRTVKRRHVGRVFALLQRQSGQKVRKEDRLGLLCRFKSDLEYMTWLDENGIPYEFNSWIATDWDD